MLKLRYVFVLVLLGGLVGVADASLIDDAIVRAGDRLVTDQGGNGSWLGAGGFTGAIVAGLVNGYELTGTASYQTAAEAGGDFILDITAYGTGSFVGFLGDEAYGLTRLSNASANPASNNWRTAVGNFYSPFNSAGVSAYVDSMLTFYGEESTPLFYVAQHALASNYVNNANKGDWRQSVIELLAGVDDTDSYPVMSLATAVWALAQTGSGLDTTVVSATGDWAGVQLQDLPGMLAGHQVASGGFADSFYWNLGHTTGGASYDSGYSEDTIYGILGLEAAGGYDAEVLSARQVLASGVDINGDVYDHIWNPTSFNYVYAGETLQALPEPTILGMLGVGALLMQRRRRRQP
ncbi:MAG: PEP-CTERM sorting domain-containing protein [Planctomycetes bacterium]|nr:PEP-CTERM sorting domain-containing protein [Planctomycetota bacterium]